MKGLVAILCFMLIFVILSGCTGTTTLSPSDNIDPIVGTWENTNSAGTTFVYRFTQSGQYFCMIQNNEEQLWGNWIKIGDNAYHAILWANKSTTNKDSAVRLTYDKNTDILSDTVGNKLYRITTSTSAQIMTPSITTQSIAMSSHAFSKPKYTVGDVISKEMPYYYQGFMISDYNLATGKYSRVELGRANCGNGKYGPWWRYGGNKWEDMDASLMEGAYPIYLGHIDDPNNIPSAWEIDPLKC